ncbi:RHS repeat-associated core domain-containing protein [Streptomyces sp. NPDC093109]|uniref:RHS repeat-associated core domain-containing protein n=1 Tax=Streptomyces sp. NPDC093109 TaxID=3154977 RepID=UPI00344D60C8
MNDPSVRAANSARRTKPTRRRRWIKATSVVTASVLLGGFLSAETAFALASLALPKLDTTKPVPVTPVGAKKPGGKDDAARDSRTSAPAVTWPAAGTAEVQLPGARGAVKRAGKLPVHVGTAAGKPRAGKRGTAPESAQVQILDRKAAGKLGVDGVLIAVRAAEGGHDAKVRLSLDYSGFANAFGAGWASRLSLVQLPDCALESPDAKDCGAGTPLATENDSDARTLTADIPVDGTAGTSDASGSPVSAAPSGAKSVTGLAAASGVTLLAVSAAPSGSTGDYKATPLSPSGNWVAGDSSGNFGWGYEIQTPEVPGGLEPELSLGYSSQSLDGRTAATNNQANAVGDGWALTENYIERRYVSCNDDMTNGNNKAKNGDLCYGTENATMSLDGQSHELVRDDKSKAWKLKDDDGTRVELLTDTARGNGDNNGEHWLITTTDGTKYHFGYNRLPGWSSGKEETNSTWTVPVYGNQSTEPCYKAAYADSYCQQAWRWNLDYVVDPNSNASAYYYKTEKNFYGRNVSSSTGLGTPTEYVRGGYLDRIEYGLRADNLYGTNAASAKVQYTVAERCLPDASFDCAPAKMTAANAKRWPDVPLDQDCKAGETCKDKIAPTFWTSKRLARITTSALVGSGYRSVDSWDFRHELPDPGDGSPATLWLAGITRTGYSADSSTALPEITFKGTQLANRVDATGDGIPPLVRYRVNQINTETGGSIGISYSAADCAPGSLPTEASNTRRCYPVYWSSADSPAADYKPVKDWFHKYVVTQVLENDLVGGSPTQQTDYTYVGGAAWAKSEDEFTKAEYRTYSDYRGYGEVRTQTGNGTDGPRQDSRTRYFRGIDGAKVADFEGNEVADHASFQAMERSEIVYNGAEVVSEETSTPWRSAVTASRARTGLPALESDMTDVQTETTRSPAKGGGWQRTKTERTFDAYGMVITETEHGDTAKTGDESCVVTTYARSTAANILELPASEKVTAGTCAAPGELISENRSYYDDSTTLGAAPTRGNTTREDENNAEGNGFFTANTSTYDPYGRPLKSTDSQGRTMTTAFTPETGPAAKTVVTNPLGHTLTTEFDVARGLQIAETDTNGKKTEIAYDDLGRVTAVWEAGRSRTAFPTAPNSSFTYRISKTDTPVVVSKELRGDGSWETGYEIYDGLLRERQTQVASGTGSGRVLTETLYDSQGQEWKSFDDYYATGDPEGKLVAGDDTKSPAVVRTVFDGAGRATDTVAMKYGTETRRTKTVYDGNHTTEIPPQGGSASTTVTDPLGRTTEIIEYTNAARTTSQSLLYGYNARGLLEKVTDAAGNVRKFTYDARGREVKAEDPDTGTMETRYDSLDRPVGTTDGRNVSLSVDYDQLGRQTTLSQGSKVLSEWKYDTVAKGEIAETRRYVNGEAYVERVTGFTDDYQATGLDVTIPSTEGALAGTYTWGFGYDEITGLQTVVNQPAIGDLPAERVVTRYGADDQAQGLTAGGRILVNSSTYDAFGRAQRTEYNDQARRLYRSWSYDEHTGDLLRTTTDRTAGPTRVEDTSYGYDLEGNVTRITTKTGQDATEQTDTQCFVSDALQRLTEAWTAKDDCTAAPSGSNIGGAQPYWLSYSYDALGNRTKETRHDTAGATAKDAVRTYKYAKPDGAKPAALTSVDTARNGTSSTTSSFTYDGAGNTVTRKTDGRDQTLEWDAENQLVKVDEAGVGATEYTYSADGGRLIRKDIAGTTLYLPGGNELLLTADGKKTGTRYYEFDGDTVAARSAGAIQFLFADHHSTATTAIDATTQDVQRRVLAPFGEERGTVSATPAAWIGRGFVNGTEDRTGLTQLGARAYDPGLGRFISVDPMIDMSESQRMNAYAYANNNPASFSDPDGLFWGKIKKAAKKVAKKVVKTTKKVANKTKRVVKKAVKTVKKVVKKVVKKTKAIAKKVARVTKKVVKRSVYVVKKYAKKTYRYVKKTTKKAGGYVKKQASRAWSGTKKATKSAARTTVKAGKAAGKGVVAGAKAVDRANKAAGDALVSGAKAVGNHVKDNWRDYAGAAALGVCIMASAGLCVAAGMAVAFAKVTASGIDPNMETDWGTFAKDSAFAFGGGAVAGAFGKAVSGGTFRAAMKASPITTSVRETLGNGALNFGMAWAGCGTGSLGKAAYC